MFYMEGTKMLFGDAKTTCDGESPLLAFGVHVGLWTDVLPAAIKRNLDEKQKATMLV
jgi:hypothetical protein